MTHHRFPFSSLAAWSLAALVSACSGTQERTDTTPTLSEREEAENEAAQQATSVRPTEGVGGRTPHPLPTERSGEARFGETGTPADAGRAGRLPETRLPAEGREAITGRVAAIDRDARELTLDAGGALTRVRVPADARITMDGATASFAELRQGTEVRVALEETAAEALSATSVDVVRDGSGEGSR